MTNFLRFRKLKLKSGGFPAAPHTLDIIYADKRLSAKAIEIKDKVMK